MPLAPRSMMPSLTVVGAPRLLLAAWTVPNPGLVATLLNDETLTEVALLPCNDAMRVLPVYVLLPLSVNVELPDTQSPTLPPPAPLESVMLAEMVVAAPVSRFRVEPAWRPLLVTVVRFDTSVEMSAVAKPVPPTLKLSVPPFATVIFAGVQFVVFPL